MLMLALDIINANAHQVHLYRHDAKSFLWVAIWVCGTYEGGKECQDASFKAWAQGDANLCLALKYGFLAGYKEKLWSKSHQAREDLLWKIRNHLDEGAITRRRQSRASGGVVQPEAPGCTDTDYKKIDDSAFSMLRKELGE